MPTRVTFRIAAVEVGGLAAAMSKLIVPLVIHKDR